LVMPPAFLTILGHRITLMSIQHRAPNKRLKLAAVIASREPECLRPGRRALAFHTLAPAGESPAA